MSTQITPDGDAFAGKDWAERVTMPSHYTNPDGTQGAAIDWSGSTFTIESAQTQDIDWNFDLPSRTVTMTLTGDQVKAIGKPFFRWYLAESGLLDAEMYYRRIKISRVE